MGAGMAYFFDPVGLNAGADTSAGAGTSEFNLFTILAVALLPGAVVISAIRHRS